MTDIPGSNNLTIPLDTTERDVISYRTNEERERDLVLLARMYVRGRRQNEIRLELNKMYPDRPLSLKTIHMDLEFIRKAWLQSSLMDFNAAKAKELARLDEAEREAWDAWERSKEKHVRIEYTVADDQVPFSADRVADVKRKSKRKVIEATVGDIRYLEMVERMIENRCKIMGLFEAQRLQIDWRTEALQAGMDEQAIDAVKAQTVETLLAAITQAARESGAIKEEDIIDAESD